MAKAQLPPVAITGLGAICGLGHNVNEIWKNALEGKSGISNIDHVDVAHLPVRFAGEVKDFSLDEELLSLKEQRRYDRFIHLALHSTHEAWLDSGLESAKYAAHKVGCIFGVGMGGFPEIERTHSTYIEKGTRRVSPFFIPGIIPNMASGLVSIKYGLQGPNYSIASACASSAHAAAMAYQDVALGRLDACITGGAESVLSDLTISGFANMKALSRNNEEPTKASCPFDKARSGFVMGEGAGILVLENYEKAKARGAKVYGLILGHGANSDAHHITAPLDTGEQAAQCVELALEASGLDANAINYINAHGTSTPLGDIAETLALKKAFGEHAKNLKVSSTKSMTGHLLGAAGGLESVFCLKALETGIIPPTINLEDQDERCDLDYTALSPAQANPQFALNNSFGFGGTNCSLIFQAHRH